MELINELNQCTDFQSLLSLLKSIDPQKVGCMGGRKFIKIKDDTGLIQNNKSTGQICYNDMLYKLDQIYIKIHAFSQSDLAIGNEILSRLTHLDEQSNSMVNETSKNNCFISLLTIIRRFFGNLFFNRFEIYEKITQSLRVHLDSDDEESEERALESPSSATAPTSPVSVPDKTISPPHKPVSTPDKSTSRYKRFNYSADFEADQKDNSEAAYNQYSVYGLFELLKEQPDHKKAKTLLEDKFKKTDGPERDEVKRAFEFMLEFKQYDQIPELALMLLAHPKWKENVRDLLVALLWPAEQLKDELFSKIFPEPTQPTIGPPQPPS
jgi:hypothetical protein